MTIALVNRVACYTGFTKTKNNENFSRNNLYKRLAKFEDFGTFFSECSPRFMNYSGKVFDTVVSLYILELFVPL